MGKKLFSIIGLATVVIIGAIIFYFQRKKKSQNSEVSEALGITDLVNKEAVKEVAKDVKNTVKEKVKTITPEPIKKIVSNPIVTKVTEKIAPVIATQKNEKVIPETIKEKVIPEAVKQIAVKEYPIRYIYKYVTPKVFYFSTTKIPKGTFKVGDKIKIDAKRSDWNGVFPVIKVKDKTDRQLVYLMGNVDFPATFSSLQNEGIISKA